MKSYHIFANRCVFGHVQSLSITNSLTFTTREESTLRKKAAKMKKQKLRKRRRREKLSDKFKNKNK